MNKPDELYLCFEEHLMTLDIENESQSEFISNVVEKFMTDLKQQGFILSNHDLELRDEIEWAVVAMLRKKIYGHFNLDHFRQAQRNEKKCNS